MQLSVSSFEQSTSMMNVVMDDHAILSGLRRKDEAIFDEVFRLYSGACVSLSRKILRSETRAHDVVQAIFIDLYMKPERFDPSRGSLRTFLLTQSRSRSIDLIRSEKSRSEREKKHGNQSIDVAQRSTLSIEEEIINLQLSESMNEALQGLSVDEREAIVLSYYKGHTYREVASLLGQPEGTVKSRIRAGLSKLKDNFRDPILEEVRI
jgi:RNA polymerase sigma-70 factor (ECF subfamily)